MKAIFLTARIRRLAFSTMIFGIPFIQLNAQPCDNDTEPPVISNCPNNVNLIPSGADCALLGVWDEPTATDNCDVTLTSTHRPGDYFGRGATRVTYTATDPSGNTTTCSFNVIANDNEDPEIFDCPNDIELSTSGNCDKSVTWIEPFAEDNCNIVDLTGTHEPGAFFPPGTTTVIYTATDQLNNTTTCSFDVTINPGSSIEIFDCPTDITVTSSLESCNSSATWTPPTVQQNCGITLTSNFASGDEFALGTTEVIYTASDNFGNSTSCSFDVTVTDNTAPVFTTCPANIQLVANSNCESVVTWDDPSVSDNCSFNISSDYASGSIFPVGATTVTYTAVDNAGNTSSCSFIVNIIDETPPLFTSCPSDITVELLSTCDTPVFWDEPVTTDNCNFQLTASYNPGETFALGTTEVSYTATDNFGNTSSCTFNINVVRENENIFSNCPEDIVVELLNTCSQIVSWEEPVLNTTCDFTLTASNNPNDEFPLGTTTVSYVATSSSGSSFTCAFNVSVLDVSPPIFENCPENIQVNVNENCTANVEWQVPSVSDNCDFALVSSHTSGEEFGVGTTTVTYTASDDSGNMSTCSFTVEVLDDTEVFFQNCPENIEVTSEGSIQVFWDEPDFPVSCKNILVNRSHQSGDIFNVGRTEISYVLSSSDGRSDSCIFFVIVNPIILNIEVSQLITPNSDGSNDLWLITNIEEYPDNVVTVVDRWGNEVFKSVGYDNDSNVWNGFNNDGNQLPNGTYYYHIRVFTASGELEKNGFLELLN